MVGGGGEGWLLESASWHHCSSVMKKEDPKYVVAAASATSRILHTRQKETIFFGHPQTMFKCIIKQPLLVAERRFFFPLILRIRLRKVGLTRFRKGREEKEGRKVVDIRF